MLLYQNRYTLKPQLKRTPIQSNSESFKISGPTYISEDQACVHFNHYLSNGGIVRHTNRLGLNYAPIK